MQLAGCWITTLLFVWIFSATANASSPATTSSPAAVSTFGSDSKLCDQRRSSADLRSGADWLLDFLQQANVQHCSNQPWLELYLQIGHQGMHVMAHTQASYVNHYPVVQA